ncbi:MAG: glycosyltransferase [Pseudomonadota bacterium]
MKIALIVTNLVGGGAEKVMIKLAAGLAGRGHEIHLILLEHLIEHAPPPQVAVHALTGANQRLSKGVLGKWAAAWRLRRLLRRLGGQRPFDLVVSTLPFADEVAVRGRLPRHWCRIADTLSTEIARLRRSSPRKAARRLRRYHKLYDHRRLIAVSDGVADDLRGPLGIRGARIERVYNPFDLAVIRARATEPAALPPRPYVIHIGRFSRQKRHDVLLDAWARLDVPHRLVLLVAPDPQLSDMISKRGLDQRVTIAGFQANPYPWIAAADLLVLSSDHEGLPNVIIEALALGTPVVSTDCPAGPREILGERFADFLVPVGDAAALAGAMARALVEPPDMSQVDLARFDAPTVWAAYERLAADG